MTCPKASIPESERAYLAPGNYIHQFYDFFSGDQIRINRAVVANEIRIIEPANKAPIRLLEANAKDANPPIPPIPTVKPARRARTEGLDNRSDIRMYQLCFIFA